MRAIFRMSGNESHPGLQLVEKLATPLPGVRKKKKRVKNLFSPFLLSYFEKNSTCVSGRSVCIFVALSVGMCVAGANRVEGTMSWLLLGTNEILASKHDIAAQKVKQEHFETAILVLHNLSSSFVYCYG